MILESTWTSFTSSSKTNKFRIFIIVCIFSDRNSLKKKAHQEYKHQQTQYKDQMLK